MTSTAATGRSSTLTSPRSRRSGRVAPTPASPRTAELEVTEGDRRGVAGRRRQAGGRLKIERARPCARCGIAGDGPPGWRGSCWPPERARWARSDARRAGAGRPAARLAEERLGLLARACARWRSGTAPTCWAGGRAGPRTCRAPPPLPRRRLGPALARRAGPRGHRPRRPQEPRRADLGGRRARGAAAKRPRPGRRAPARDRRQRRRRRRPPGEPELSPRGPRRGPAGPAGARGRARPAADHRPRLLGARECPPSRAPPTAR